MAKKMKRRSTGKKHPSPSPRARAKYHQLIVKGAERTMATLAKHQKSEAKRIADKTLRSI